MAVDNQVLIAALGVYVGFLLHDFFEAIIRDIVLPLISPLASVEGESAKLVFLVGGVKLNFGNLIVSVIDMVIAFGVISVVLPYLKEYVPVAGRR